MSSSCLQVIRTHTSPYQKKDFLEKERHLFSEISGLKYLTLQEATDAPAIIITNTHTKLRDLAPKLLEVTKLIVHPNSGYDHFTVDTPLWEGIPLVVGHSIRAQAVAEYSLACVFQGLAELPHHMAWQTDRRWDRKLLKGTNVAVFGNGHIGKIIIQTLRALGMNVSVVDPYVEGCLKHWRDLNLRTIKVVILAMGLNQTNHGYFSEEFFKLASPELLFINGARGKLVDEKSLKNFLLLNPEAFAFLDVFEKEPFGVEWQGFPQVWKTSHIAGVEQYLDEKILRFEVDVINDFLSLEKQIFLKKYEKELLQNKWIKGVLV